MPKRFDPQTGRRDYWRKATSASSPGGHSHPPADIIPQGAGSLLDADLLDGHTSSYFQTQDADLDAIAALSSTGLLARIAADNWVLRSILAGSSKISVTNGDGVGGNPTIDAVEANFDIANLGGTLAHSALSGIGADDHHAKVHALVDLTNHPESGLTAGHVVRASGATAYGFAQLQHSDLGAVGANDHHNKVHSLIDLTNHPESGLTVGHVVRATGAAAYAFGAIQASDLPDVETLSTSIGANRVVYSDGSNLVGDGNLNWYSGDGELRINRTAAPPVGSPGGLTVERAIRAIGDGADANFRLFSFGADPQMLFYKTLGTGESSPGVITDDTRLFQLRAAGAYAIGPLSWGTAAYMECQANENWDASGYGTRWVWYTCANRATSVSEVLRLVAENTQGSPLLSLMGDDDTGLWHPAPDILAISTAALERIRFNSAGEVLIGRTTSIGSAYELQVEDNIAIIGDGVEPGLDIFGYGTSPQFGGFISRRARGSEASPALVQDDDILLHLRATGHTGSGWATGAYIEGIVHQTGNWSPTQTGTAVRVTVVEEDSTTPREASRLRWASGESGPRFGLGITDPQAVLHAASGVGSVGAYPAGYEPVAIFQDNASSSHNCVAGLQAGVNGAAALYLGSSGSPISGGIVYWTSAGTMYLRTGSGNRVTLTNSLFSLAVNADLNAHYMDIDAITVPDPPGSGTRRIFCDSTNNDELSVIKSDDSVVSLEGAGAGVGGSGSAGQLAFWTAGTTLSGDNDLWWDIVNKRFGVGTSSPVANALATIDGALALTQGPSTPPTSTDHIVAAVYGGFDTLFIRAKDRCHIALDYDDDDTDSDFTIFRDGADLGVGGVISLLTVDQNANLIVGQVGVPGSIGIAKQAGGGAIVRLRQTGTPLSGSDNRMILDNNAGTGHGECHFEINDGFLTWDPSADSEPSDDFADGNECSMIGQYVYAGLTRMVHESLGSFEFVLDSDNDDSDSQFRITRHHHFDSTQACLYYYLPLSWYGETCFSVTERGLVYTPARKIHRKEVDDANYTLDTWVNQDGVDDLLIAYTALTAARTVTIPAGAAGNLGRMICIKDESGSAGTYNISVSVSIEGSTTLVSTNYGQQWIYSAGTAGWFKC